MVKKKKTVNSLKQLKGRNSNAAIKFFVIWTWACFLLKFSCLNDRHVRDCLRTTPVISLPVCCLVKTAQLASEGVSLSLSAAAEIHTDLTCLSCYVSKGKQIYPATEKKKDISHVWPPVGHCDACGGHPCLIVGVVFLCHTLPCAQQQPQHRERLETFDDIIRSSLEVTGRNGRGECVLRGSVFGPDLVCEKTGVYAFITPPFVCLHI